MSALGGSNSPLMVKTLLINPPPVHMSGVGVTLQPAPLSSANVHTLHAGRHGETRRVRWVEGEGVSVLSHRTDRARGHGSWPCSLSVPQRARGHGSWPCSLSVPQHGQG
ncbi:hypothetical protein ACOMHN_002529 [Nucella lapillus]